MNSEIIINKFKDLPVKAQRELIDFLDYLVLKYKKPSKKKGLSFDWEAGLSGIKINTNSLELQHLANNFR